MTVADFGSLVFPFSLGSIDGAPQRDSAITDLRDVVDANTSLIGVSSRRAGGVVTSILSAMCEGIRTMTNCDGEAPMTANPASTERGWTPIAEE